MSAPQTSVEDKKLLAIRNISTGGVILSGNPLFEVLSSTRGDVDEKGHVRHVEMIQGQPRELMVNMGGQFKLDQKNRGGKRLYERIYSEERLYEVLKERNIDIGETKFDKKESTKKKAKAPKLEEASSQSTNKVNDKKLEQTLANL